MRRVVADDGLHSINAMIPDPNALIATSASDALLDNQALQTNSTRDAIATVIAQAIAIEACFTNLITGNSISETLAPIDCAISLTK